MVDSLWCVDSLMLVFTLVGGFPSYMFVCVIVSFFFSSFENCFWLVGKLILVQPREIESEKEAERRNVIRAQFYGKWKYPSIKDVLCTNIDTNTHTLTHPSSCSQQTYLPLSKNIHANKTMIIVSWCSSFIYEHLFYAC